MSDIWLTGHLQQLPDQFEIRFSIHIGLALLNCENRREYEGQQQPYANVREDERPKTINPHQGVPDAENTALVRHRRVVVLTMFQKDTTSQTNESPRLATVSNDYLQNSLSTSLRLRICW